MKSVEYLLDIKNLSKSFQRRGTGKGGYTTLKSSLLNIFRSSSTPQKVITNAITNLTLRIPRGSSVGIIGKNGSGKSTLLKLISGIYKPDKGSIEVQGRIAALIELGAGFHPDFSGRENLYLGGIMHGLTRKEIDERFDQIVQFAELEGVIDDPVRTYSSGMFMRLGFSLAIHTDPDLLIIDEVLAVGDAAFVVKCKEKVSQLRKEGKTLLLVSHDLDAVERWCDEALWLHQGEVKDRGNPRRVIDHYREFIERGEEAELQEKNDVEGETLTSAPQSKETTEKARWGSKEIEITRVTLKDKNGEERLLFHPHEEVVVEAHYTVREPQKDPVFGIGIHRGDGLPVFATNTHLSGIKVPSLEGKGVVSIRLERLGLLDGQYRLDIAVHAQDGYPYDYHQGALFFASRSAIPHLGVYEPAHSWEFST